MIALSAIQTDVAGLPLLHKDMIRQEDRMSLFNRIPGEFYKLFTSKYTEYYMTFLVAIYNAM